MDIITLQKENSLSSIKTTSSPKTATRKRILSIHNSIPVISGRPPSVVELNQILTVFRRRCIDNRLSIPPKVEAEFQNRISKAEKGEGKSKLNFSHCGLEENHLIQLFESLEESPVIAKLDLRGNRFTNRTAMQLIKLLADQSKYVKKLEPIKRINHNYLAIIDISDAIAALDQGLVIDMNMYVDVLQYCNVQASCYRKFQTLAEPNSINLDTTLHLIKEFTGKQPRKTELNEFFTSNSRNGSIDMVTCEKLLINAMLTAGILNTLSEKQLSMIQQTVTLPAFVSQEQTNKVAVEEHKEDSRPGIRRRHSYTAVEEAPVEPAAPQEHKRLPMKARSSKKGLFKNSALDKVFLGRFTTKAELSCCYLIYSKRCEDRLLEKLPKVEAEFSKRLSTEFSKAKLNFENAGMTDEYLVELVEGLNEAPIISKLELQGNNFTDRGIIHLLKLQSDQIKSVKNNNITTRLNSNYLAVVDLGENLRNIDLKLIDEMDTYMEILCYVNSQTYIRRIYESTKEESVSEVNFTLFNSFAKEVLGRALKKQEVDIFETENSLVSYSACETFLLNKMVEIGVIVGLTDKQLAMITSEKQNEVIDANGRPAPMRRRHSYTVEEKHDDDTAGAVNETKSTEILHQSPEISTKITPSKWQFFSRQSDKTLFGRSIDNQEFSRFKEKFFAHCAERQTQLSSKVEHEFTRRIKGDGKAKLSLSHCNLDDLQILCLIDTIVEFPVIAKIEIKGNNFTNDGLLRLVKLVGDQTKQFRSTEDDNSKIEQSNNYLGFVDISDNTNKLDESLLADLQHYTQVLQHCNVKTFIKRLHSNAGSPLRINQDLLAHIWKEVLGAPPKRADLTEAMNNFGDNGTLSLQMTQSLFIKKLQANGVLPILSSRSVNH